MSRARVKSSEPVQYRTRALKRGLCLLALFGPGSPELTLTELAERGELDKATTLRLMSCLVEEGFVRRDTERNVYRAGPAVLPVAISFQQTTALAAVAEPYLRALAKETGQTATMAIQDGAHAVNIALAYSDRPIRRLTYVGERFALDKASVGIVLAEGLRDEELVSLLDPSDPDTAAASAITNWSEFRAGLNKFREEGYAFDDEGAFAGIRCLGAPVRDYTRRAVAAVSVTGAAGEFVGDALAEYIEQVKAVASSISAELGYVEIGSARGPDLEAATSAGITADPRAVDYGVGLLGDCFIGPGVDGVRRGMSMPRSADCAVGD
jgi:DNA-binding IclR family transcriptional regulator